MGKSRCDRRKEVNILQDKPGEYVVGGHAVARGTREAINDNNREHVRFCVLRPFEVIVGGAILGSLPASQRALLVRLLMSPGRVVEIQDLAEAVWFDRSPPSDPKGALYTVVSRARASLRSAGSVLVKHGTGYMLDIPRASVDAWRFDDLFRNSRALAAADPCAALSLCEQGLSLWQGPAFGEFANTFARHAAVALEEARAAASELRVELLLKLQRFADACTGAEALVAAHPLRETAWRLLLRTLAASGRQAEALEAFQSLRGHLSDRLGVEPSSQTAAVHQQILQGTLPEGNTETLPVPPRTRGGTARLPAPLTTFIGRVHELDAITNALAQSRLVSIVGPGGIGKTRLAIEFAQRRATSGDTYWVDLASLRDPEAAVHAFCDALGIVEVGGSAAFDSLVVALSRSSALLVVDNCEHVIDVVAELVAGLLQQCHHLAILATSREPLAVAGEHVVRLQPLPLTGASGTAADSDAVKLLLDRLQAQQTQQVQSDTSSDLIQKVASQLEGIPLALELAAARAASLGLDAVVEALRDCHVVLYRGQPDRHRSLEAVFDWSWQLLDESERRVLACLSVIVGWFSADQAMGLCCLDGRMGKAEVEASLARLVAKSLVIFRPGSAGGGDYRMLEVVRHYAERRLEQFDQLAGMRRAYARQTVAWVEEQASEIGRPGEDLAWAQLSDQAAQLRAVHAWARQHNETDLAVRLSAALHWYAFFRDDNELLGWASAVLQMPGAADHPLWPIIVSTVALKHLNENDKETAHKLAAEAAEQALTRNDCSRVIPFIVLGDVKHFIGMPGDALAHYDRAWRSAVEEADPLGAVESAGNAALTLMRQGDQDGMRLWLDRCLSVLSHAPSALIRMCTLYYAGECTSSTEPQRALTYYRRCSELASQLGANLTAYSVTGRLTSLESRDPWQQLEALRRSLNQWLTTGNRRMAYVTLLRLVPVLMKLGEEEAAAAIYFSTIQPRDGVPSVYLRQQPVADAVDELWRRIDDEREAIRIQWLGTDLERAATYALSTISRVQQSSPESHHP